MASYLLKRIVRVPLDARADTGRQALPQSQVDLHICAELRPNAVNQLLTVQRPAVGKRGGGNVLIFLVVGVNVAGADDPAEARRPIRTREPELLRKDGLI